MTNKKTNKFAELLQKNKKSLAIVVILVAGAAVFLNTQSLNFSNGSDDQVIATINGKKVYRSDAADQLATIFAESGLGQKAPTLDEIPQDAIIELVRRIALEKELEKIAKRERIAKDPEIKAQVASFEKNLVRNNLLESVSRVSPDSDKVSKQYEELKASLEGKKEAKISHILVKTKKEANKARALVSIEGFGPVAKKLSIDKGSAQKGGSLGYTLRDALVKEFADAAFALKKGRLSKPVKTQFGWHIIKLEDIRDAQIAPLEDIKSQIANSLTQQAQQKFIENVLDGIDIKLVESEASVQNPAEESAAEEVSETTQNQEAEEITVNSK